jgi:anti-sigma regulatory factor (Ser/Thr protein kinase)
MVDAMNEPVELTIPVQSDLVVLARLTAATVASRAGFDVEEVEDLRLAVDELCVSIVNGADNGRLNLTFLSDDGSVEVVCVLEGTVQAQPVNGDGYDEHDLSIRILDALVDEHGEDTGDGGRRVWLRKRSTRHAGS